MEPVRAFSHEGVPLVHDRDGSCNVAVLHPSEDSYEPWRIRFRGQQGLRTRQRARRSRSGESTGPEAAKSPPAGAPVAVRGIDRPRGGEIPASGRAGRGPGESTGPEAVKSPPAGAPVAVRGIDRPEAVKLTSPSAVEFSQEYLRRRERRYLQLARNALGSFGRHRRHRRPPERLRVTGRIRNAPGDGGRKGRPCRTRSCDSRTHRPTRRGRDRHR